MGNFRHSLTQYLDELNGMPEPYASEPDTITITTAGDNTSPATPENLTASNGTERISVEWDEVTKNEDGSDCNDLDEYRVYYVKDSNYTGSIDPEDEFTYDGVEPRKTLSWSQEVPAGEKRHYTVTTIDYTGNESPASNEDSATSKAIDVSSYISDYTDNFDEVLVGDGIIGLIFRQPDPAWSGFSHYVLYRDINSKSSWTKIFEGNSPAYIDKGLSTNTSYKYKLAFVDNDGNETSGTIRDNSGNGYTPDNADNSNITDNTFLAQNIVAVNEVRGDSVYAESQIVLGGVDDSGFIKSSNYSAGTDGFKINAAGDAEFNNVTVRGQVEISSGSGISNLSDAGDLSTKDKALVSNGDVGIDGSLIVTGDMKSQNFSSGSTGWKIDGSNDSAEFQNITARGSIEITGGSGISNLTDSGNLATLDEVDETTITDGSVKTPKLAAQSVTSSKVSVNAKLSVGGLYNLAKAVYNSSLDISGQELIVRGACFNDSGSKLYIVGSDSVSVHSYDLPYNYDISLGSYNQSFDVSPKTSDPAGITFNDLGTKMYIADATNGSILSYNLNTSYDISTASFSQSFSVSSQTGSPESIEWNDNGSKFYIAGNAVVYSYTVSTNYDISTASYNNSFDVSSEADAAKGFKWGKDGAKGFVTDSVGEVLVEYDASIVFDISSLFYSGTSFSVSSEDGAPNGMTWSQKGTSFCVAGLNTDKVYKYNIDDTVEMGSNVFDSDPRDGIKITGGRLQVEDNSGRSVFDSSGNFSAMPTISNISNDANVQLISANSKETVLTISESKSVLGGLVFMAQGANSATYGSYVEIADDSGNSQMIYPDLSSDATAFNTAQWNNSALVYPIPSFLPQGSAEVNVYNEVDGDRYAQVLVWYNPN